MRPKNGSWRGELRNSEFGTRKSGGMNAKPLALSGGSGPGKRVEAHKPRLRSPGRSGSASSSDSAKSSARKPGAWGTLSPWAEFSQNRPPLLRHQPGDFGFRVCDDPSRALSPVI